MNYRELSAVLTRRGEKCVLVGYPDVGGVPTWGWGHTGPEVHIGQSITQERADIDFDRDQAMADAKLRRHVPPEPFAAMTEHEKAALLDFVFNTGGGPETGDKSEWTIWKDVRAGKLADVPAQIGRFVYVHVDGKPVTSTGLKNRRTAEVVLWNTADVEAAVATATAGGNTVSSASTRALPTPPVPAAPKTMDKASLGVKVGTCVSAAAAACLHALPDLQDKVQQAHDLASAHAADNHYVGAVASTLSAVVVCLGVAALFIHAHQHEAAKV